MSSETHLLVQRYRLACDWHRLRCIICFAESDPSDYDEDEDEDSEEFGYYDSDDDDIYSLSRVMRRANRAMNRAARRSGRQVREVTELGVPMAVLVPQDMSMNGGASADKAVKEVRGLR